MPSTDPKPPFDPTGNPIPPPPAPQPCTPKPAPSGDEGPLPERTDDELKAYQKRNGLPG